MRRIVHLVLIVAFIAGGLALPQAAMACCVPHSAVHTMSTMRAQRTTALEPEDEHCSGTHLGAAAAPPTQAHLGAAAAPPTQAHHGCVHVMCQVTPATPAQAVHVQDDMAHLQVPLMIVCATEPAVRSQVPHSFWAAASLNRSPSNTTVPLRI